MKAIKAIYALLSADSNVTATVYPSRVLESSAFPAVVLTQISRTANDTKREYSKSDVARVQVSCIGNTQTQAFDLAESVRVAMRADVPEIYSDVLVQNIAFDDEQIIESDTTGTRGVTMVVQDYLVMFSNV